MQWSPLVREFIALFTAIKHKHGEIDRKVKVFLQGRVTFDLRSPPNALGKVDLRP